MSVSKWFNSAMVEVPDSTVMANINEFGFIIKGMDVGKTGPFKTSFINKDDEIFENFSHPDGTNLEYGVSFRQINMLGGDVLHDYGFLGRGKLIAVIDGGFFKVNELPAFDSLINAGRIIDTYDFIERNKQVYEDSPHGMQVLSTMGGNLPGQLVGTAPNADYVLLRSELTSSEFLTEEEYWVSAAEYADSIGADIINSSLGYTTFDDPSQDHTYQDMNGNTTRVTIGADMAASKGILVVNSAGNSGNNSWKFIGAPADADSILSIGAVDSTGKLAGFSSRGPSSDGQVKPEIVAMGQLTVLSATSGSGVVRGNGTSFSSPVIAGLAACLWEAHPELSAMQIRQSIIESASQFNTPDGNLGYGIPDFITAHIRLSGYDMRLFNSDSIIRIFPNPFSGGEMELDFFSEKDQTLNIEVYNIAGQQCFVKNFPAKKISFNKIRIPEATSLNQGMYFLILKTEKGRFINKFIRN